MKNFNRRNSDEESLTAFGLSPNSTQNRSQTAMQRNLKGAKSASLRPLYTSKLECAECVEPESTL